MRQKNADTVRELALRTVSVFFDIWRSAIGADWSCEAAKNPKDVSAA